MSYDSSSAPSSVRILTNTVLSFLCGMIFSCAELGSIPSPIPAAAAFCADPLGAAGVLLGAVASCFISDTFTSHIPLLISLMLAASVRIILRECRSCVFISSASALCVLAAGIDASLAKSGGAEGILVSVMSAVLTGTTACFLDTVIHSFENRRRIHIGSSVGCAAAVVYFVLIAALCSFEFAGINPGYVIGTAVTLLAAQRYRSTGGVICGALTACGAMLSSQELGVSLAFLPVTGLIAGYMSDNGGFVSAGSFFLFNMLAQITIGSSSSAFSAVGNLMAGCMVYLLLHTVCFEKWLSAEDSSSVRITENISARMNFMADSIAGVRMDTEKISELLAHCEYNESLNEDRTAVCAACGIRESCTGGESAETCRVRQLEMKKSRLMKEKTAGRNECRRILFQQISAAEQILSSFAGSIKPDYSPELTDSIERRLERNGYYFDLSAAYYNEKDRLMIELYSTDAEYAEEIDSVRNIISGMLGAELMELERVRTGRMVRYCLSRIPKFYFKSESAFRCAENGDVSGDTTISFVDCSGQFYTVLSDGMGTGRQAAVESKMTAEMFRKLISSGVDAQSAVKIINGLMLTKSDNESFATLDAVCLDPDTPEITLMKAGASSTIVCQGERVLRICAPTFPIGSSSAADVFVKKMKIKAGDIVVLMSDGIPESQYSFIKELLLSSDDMKYIADEICRKADVFCGGKCRDDVSVTVMKLCTRTEKRNKENYFC